MVHISERANAHFLEVLQALIVNGREAGQDTIHIRNPAGSPIATLTLHEAKSTRPKDLPRAMRPKQKLSKRQRDAAKRVKLGRGQKVLA